jgi:hypothetical protein
MTRRFVLLAALAALSAASLVAQTDAPYVGVWKFNPSKSDLGPIQFTFTEKNGSYTFSEDMTRQTYTFKVDGAGYADPSGATARWTQKDARTWHVTYAVNGKQVASADYIVSPDEKTLTMRSNVEGNKSLTQEMVMQRVGGGSGLIGTWRGGKMQLPPYELHFTADGADGIVMRMPDVMEAKARFDGKPYPLTGGIMPQGASVTFTRTEPRAFRMQQKIGTTTNDLTVTVSTDGKTMTQTGMVDGRVKISLVFDRIK